MEVREADNKDIVIIASTGHWLSKGTKYEPYYDSKSTFELLTNIRKMGGFVAVAETNNTIVGAIAAAISPLAFTAIPTCVQMGFVVAKEYRGSKAAKLLLEAMIDWSEKQGVTILQAGVSAEDNPERVEKFHKKYGFRRIGYLYVRD